MRAAVYYNNRDIRIEERPTPKAGPGEMVVRIDASGRPRGTSLLGWGGAVSGQAKFTFIP